MTAYARICIPVEMTAEISEIIETGDEGYRSIAEFIKDAIRRRLREVYDTRAVRIQYVSSGNEGEGLLAAKQPAATAVTKPRSDAPKDTSKKKRSGKAAAARQGKRQKGSIDSFVEA